MCRALLLLLFASPVSAWPWPEPRRDVHGDPLPAGAVQRLGMARYRFPGAVFQFPPDGKSIVAVSWGRYVSRLDAKTGRVSERFTLPVEDARDAYLFPDGRRAILARRPPRGWNGSIHWEVWDLERRVRVSDVSGVQWDWEPAFEPGGDLIAAASLWRGTEGEAVTLHLIDARTGRVREVDRVAVLPGPNQRSVHPV
ncbi:MAG TPA: hypothetical protein VKD90_30260, partial [Gemmataceae bacterium]|nr:hypothetical protein [Gemmataceae bacterium]